MERKRGEGEERRERGARKEPKPYDRALSASHRRHATPNRLLKHPDETYATYV
jgi:hypothetical protein